MLKIISVFAASDGLTFKTSEEAMAHEISLLALNKVEYHESLNVGDQIGDFVVSHSKEIIAILTDKPVANPRKPRKDKGTTRIKPLPQAA